MIATKKARKRTKTQMLPAFREGDLTFEDFVAIIPDGVKADLLDGVIYVASPDNTDAGELNNWLSCVMFGFAEVKDLGKVYSNKIAYRIGLKRGPEPDIGFLPKHLVRRRRRGYIDAPPAVAVEIVSPDSVQRDYVLKRRIYEKAGVQEYWILDPDAGRATFLRLQKGKYVAVSPVNFIFESSVLPGFRIDVRWVNSFSRPLANQVLQDLLK